MCIVTIWFCIQIYFVIVEEDSHKSILVTSDLSSDDFASYCLINSGKRPPESVYLLLKSKWLPVIELYV